MSNKEIVISKLFEDSVDTDTYMNTECYNYIDMGNDILNIGILEPIEWEEVYSIN